MRLQANALIDNTLQLTARAAYLAKITHASELPRLCRHYASLPAPPLVLGSGSNVVFCHDYPGLVLQFTSQKIRLLCSDTEYVTVRVGAGLNWHALVRWCLSMGYHGLENLALIPGKVGAAPIQNIGAYGVELATFVVAVGVFDTQQQSYTALPAKACNFGYRDSRFKAEPGRWLITHVDLQLRRHAQPEISYPALRNCLATDHPQPKQIFDSVVKLRRRRLPDPRLIPNVGSFFKNPVTSQEFAEDLRRELPDLSSFPMANGQCKLAAAQLIEECGLRGYSEGRVMVSNQHALVITATNGANGSEVVALARTIRERVFRRWRVRLDPEPRLIGADWSEIW